MSVTRKTTSPTRSKRKPRSKAPIEVALDALIAQIDTRDHTESTGAASADVVGAASAADIDRAWQPAPVPARNPEPVPADVARDSSADNSASSGSLGLETRAQTHQALDDLAASLEDESASEPVAATFEGPEDVERDTAGESPAGEGDDLVGAELANQIQELLDDAAKKQQQSVTPAAPTAQATAAAEVAPSGEPESSTSVEVDEADEPEGEFEPAASVVGAEAPAASAEAPASTQPAPAEQGGEPASVDKIDEYLAEHADDAVAGEFETVNDVLSADERSDAAAHAVAVVAMGDAAAVAPRSAAPLAEKPGASAADVARELDDQPEKRSPDAQASAMPAAADDDDQPAPAPGPGLAAGFARRLCVTVSAPLTGVSKSTRDGVGWVAVVTLFVAVILLTYLAVFGNEGPQPAHASSVQIVRHEKPGKSAGHAKPAPSKSASSKAAPSKSAQGGH